MGPKCWKVWEKVEAKGAANIWIFGRWKAKALEALGRGLARCQVHSGSSCGQQWSANMVQHGPILVIIYHQIVMVLECSWHVLEKNMMYIVLNGLSLQKLDPVWCLTTGWWLDCFDFATLATLATPDSVSCRCVSQHGRRSSMRTTKPVLHEASPAGVRRNCEGNKGQPNRRRNDVFVEELLFQRHWVLQQSFQRRLWHVVAVYCTLDIIRSSEI